MIPFGLRKNSRYFNYTRNAAVKTLRDERLLANYGKYTTMLACACIEPGVTLTALR